MKTSGKPKSAMTGTADSGITGAAVASSIAIDGSFPIVGIGASAGGLEALERFFKHVAADTGMAFIIVQHLDPGKTTSMPELIQRVTPMAVHHARSRMRVQRNAVYVTPPNKDLSILHGALHLFEPVVPRGLRVPIDFFFRSLALDRRENAIGVILSGTGTDGALGLRAIRENAGLILVQNPADASFKGMPQQAIDAGLADIVATADELPAKIMAFRRQMQAPYETEAMREIRAPGALEKIFILLRERTGADFSAYKPSSLARRIDRRMGLHQIDKLHDYVRFLRENRQELDLLFRELLIGVTSFFRDAAVWERLKSDVFPALMAAHPEGMRLRAWVPACSTGEEAYSLAISFLEAIASHSSGSRYSLQIFATDLDPDAITQARRGFYPRNIASEVSPQCLARFFTAEEKGFAVSKALREMVTFAVHNVVSDPPFTKLDLVCCRNLLIYLNAETQAGMLALFHYALNPNGLLVLGHAETTGTASELFTSFAAREKIERRKETAKPAAVVSLAAMRQQPVIAPWRQHRATTRSDTAREADDGLTLRQLVGRILLLRYAPAAVLVNAEGDILYVSGSTGRYLEPAAGKADWNIFAMARDGLRYPLADAMRAVAKQAEAVTLKNLQISHNGQTHWLNLTLEAVNHKGQAGNTILIVFSEVSEPAQAPRRRSARTAGESSSSLATELRQARDEIQVLRDEIRGSRDELQSTQQELQCNIAELQSANEELVSSHEEMESLNEELLTVNTELRAKLEDLTAVQDDMKNMLNSTELACIFLDNNLRIRSFTPFAAHVFKLREIDIGRPLSDIATALDYPRLREDMQYVLETQQQVGKQAQSDDGRWFKLRIMPYRTANDVVDGAVITLTDITEARQLPLE